MNKWIAASLCIVCIVSGISLAANGTIAGTGTETDPFLIEDKADFLAFCADNSYSGMWDSNKYTELISDIDLSTESLTKAPIGWNTTSAYTYSGVSYRGIFKGNNHTISNMTINGENYIALFGVIENSSIVSDLNLVNINCTASGYYAAGICGRSNSGTIRNCYVQGTINGTRYCAGICGFNTGYSIEDSSVDIDIVSTGSENGGITAVNASQIRNCTTTGSIQGTSMAGGIAGSMGSGTLIEYCTADMDIDCQGSFVGGIVGSSQGTVQFCQSAGTIDNRDDDSTNIIYYTGGICGFNNYGDIFCCSSSSDIYAEHRVGGVCGYMYGDSLIYNCCATGQVKGTKEVGGFLGFHNAIDGIVNHCFSTGVVVEVTSSSSGYVNGFVGYKPRGYMYNCFWDAETDNITSTYPGTTNYEAAGMSTEDLQDINSFGAFDFLDNGDDGSDDYWRLCVDNPAYPELQWSYAQHGDIACGEGVNENDLEKLANYWLINDTNDDWSDNVDINHDGYIGLMDLSIMAQNWLI